MHAKMSVHAPLVRAVVRSMLVLDNLPTFLDLFEDVEPLEASEIILKAMQIVSENYAGSGKLLWPSSMIESGGYCFAMITEALFMRKREQLCLVHPDFLMDLTRVFLKPESVAILWCIIFQCFGLQTEGRSTFPIAFATDLMINQGIENGGHLREWEWLKTHRCVSCNKILWGAQGIGCMVDLIFYKVCSKSCKAAVEKCHCMSCGIFPMRDKAGYPVLKKTKYEQESNQRFCNKACQRTFRKTANLQP